MQTSNNDLLLDLLYVVCSCIRCGEGYICVRLSLPRYVEKCVVGVGGGSIFPAIILPPNLFG